MKKYLGFIASLCLLLAFVVSSCSSDDEDVIGTYFFDRIDILADGVDLSEGIYHREEIPILEGTIDSNATDFTLKSTGYNSDSALMFSVSVDGEEGFRADFSFSEIPLPSDINMYEGDWGHVICLHSEEYFEYAIHIEENDKEGPRVFLFRMGDLHSNCVFLFLTQEAKP